MLRETFNVLGISGARSHATFKAHYITRRSIGPTSRPNSVPTFRKRTFPNGFAMTLV